MRYHWIRLAQLAMSSGLSITAFFFASSSWAQSESTCLAPPNSIPAGLKMTLKKDLRFMSNEILLGKGCLLRGFSKKDRVGLTRLTVIPRGTTFTIVETPCFQNGPGGTPIIMKATASIGAEKDILLSPACYCPEMGCEGDLLEFIMEKMSPSMTFDLPNANGKETSERFVWDVAYTGEVTCFPEDPKRPGYPPPGSPSVSERLCETYPGSAPGGAPTYVSAPAHFGDIRCYLEDPKRPGQPRQNSLAVNSERCAGN